MSAGGATERRSGVLGRLGALRPPRRRGPRPGRRSPHRDDYPSLLDRVIAGSLEPDYELVYKRRGAAAATGGAPSRRRRGVTAVVLALFALLIVEAVLENREDEPTDALVRETLVSTAAERRDTLADLQAELADARDENSELATRSSRAAAERAEALDRLRAVASASGFQAVSGPGLTLVVDDAPQEAGGELVRSDDLALLVDGLWEAGAEAIAVNGERLTARSAITTANVSININRRPLTAPYTVRATGDPEGFEERLTETQGGGAWLLLVEEFGFGYQVGTSEDLELPAARELLLTTCGACYPEPADPQGPDGP